ncbi:MAG: 50S ribosomal protein L21e, partial [Candidatus Altiarchaeota archaeon]|nr:50S ribosomal protein L21e [Candidatus Altiarchaeota archaeon]
ERGKVKIKKRLQTFSENDTVALSIDPSYQSIPFSRFMGYTGKIVGQQGRAYYIEFKTGGKIKKVLANPEHIVKLK